MSEPPERMPAGPARVRQDLTRLLGEAQAGVVLERRSLPPSAAPDLLADRRLAGETLRFLFGLPGWSTDYPVKVALALHPRCPLSLLRILVNSLRLTDLVQVMGSREIPRAAARMAADLFGKRLPDTPLGRKIQLSRTGGRLVHEQLLQDRDPRVLTFLLDGPLLTEGDLVKLLRHRETTAEMVALVAGAGRWNSRYRLRLELVRHPHTTGEARLTAAEGLLLQDLQLLLEQKDLSPGTQRVLYTVLDKRIEAQSDEEQLALARSGPGRHTVNLLLGGRREAVLLRLLRDGRLDPAQRRALANDPHCPAAVRRELGDPGEGEGKGQATD